MVLCLRISFKFLSSPICLFISLTAVILNFGCLGLIWEKSNEGTYHMTGLWPSENTNIFVKFITEQKYSYNKAVKMTIEFWVIASWRTVLKCHSIKKVENHRFISMSPISHASADYIIWNFFKHIILSMLLIPEKTILPILPLLGLDWSQGRKKYVSQWVSTNFPRFYDAFTN